jgi:hypothetical protein
VKGGDGRQAPLEGREAEIVGLGPEVKPDRLRGGREPLPIIFFAPVPKVLQVRGVRFGGVLRLSLGGKVLQPGEALLQLAQTLGLFQGLGFRDALRPFIRAVPRIRAIFSDLREGRRGELT